MNSQYRQINEQLFADHQIFTITYAIVKKIDQIDCLFIIFEKLKGLAVFDIQANTLLSINYQMPYELGNMIYFSPNVKTFACLAYEVDQYVIKEQYIIIFKLVKFEIIKITHISYHSKTHLDIVRNLIFKNDYILYVKSDKIIGCYFINGQKLIYGVNLKDGYTILSLRYHNNKIFYFDNQKLRITDCTNRQKLKKIEDYNQLYSIFQTFDNSDFIFLTMKYGQELYQLWNSNQLVSDQPIPIVSPYDCNHTYEASFVNCKSDPSGTLLFEVFHLNDQVMIRIIEFSSGKIIQEVLLNALNENSDSLYYTYHRDQILNISDDLRYFTVVSTELSIFEQINK